MVNYTKDKKDPQCQGEIDEGLDVLGKKKQVLGDIHFGKNGGVGKQRRHPLGGGFAEIGKNQVAAKHVYDIMWCVAAKIICEDHCHYQ